jgi:hypothetical protein
VVLVYFPKTEMPLILADNEIARRHSDSSTTLPTTLSTNPRPSRRQSQLSAFAKSVLMNTASSNNPSVHSSTSEKGAAPCDAVAPTPIHAVSQQHTSTANELKPVHLVNNHPVNRLGKDGVGVALSDTPEPTAPSSPRM